MEYGADSPCPLVRPRVSVYSGSLISKLIMADTVGLRGSVPCRVFGGGKVLFFFTPYHKKHVSLKEN
jgi:hypothetical protein